MAGLLGHVQAQRRLVAYIPACAFVRFAHVATYDASAPFSSVDVIPAGLSLRVELVNCSGSDEAIVAYC